MCINFLSNCPMVRERYVTSGCDRTKSSKNAHMGADETLSGRTCRASPGNRTQMRRSAINQQKRWQSCVALPMSKTVWYSPNVLWNWMEVPTHKVTFRRTVFVVTDIHQRKKTLVEFKTFKVGRGLVEQWAEPEGRCSQSRQRRKKKSHNNTNEICVNISNSFKHSTTLDHLEGNRNVRWNTAFRFHFPYELFARKGWKKKVCQSEEMYMVRHCILTSKDGRRILLRKI